MQQRKPTSDLTTGNTKSKNHNKYLRMSDDQFIKQPSGNTKELMSPEEFKEFCRKRRAKML